MAERKRMTRQRALFACCAAALSATLIPSRAQQALSWEKETESRIEELAQKNGPGKNQKLAKRLMVMRKSDQAVRTPWLTRLSSMPVSAVKSQDETDRRLTAELKKIVSRYGWPTIELVGLQASKAAGLILTHSPDHDFQRKLLPALMQLVQEDRIAGMDVALIMDKILVAEGKPQRFGTQFAQKDSKAIILPVEDPEHLEQRRAKFLLPPMSEYKKMLESMYHMKIQ